MLRQPGVEVWGKRHTEYSTVLQFTIIKLIWDEVQDTDLPYFFLFSQEILNTSLTFHHFFLKKVKQKTKTKQNNSFPYLCIFMTKNCCSFLIHTFYTIKKSLPPASNTDTKYINFRCACCMTELKFLVNRFATR